MEYYTLEIFLKRKPIRKIEKYITKEIEQKLQHFLNQTSRKEIGQRFDVICNFIKYNPEVNWAESFKLKTHSISLNVCIQRYGKSVGSAIFEKHAKECATTKEKYLSTGHDEKDWETCCKNKRSIGKNIMIERYGKEIGEQKWKEYLQKWKKSINRKKDSGTWKISRTLEWYIEKYGEDQGFKLWDLRNKRQSYRFSLKYYIDKFGEEKGDEEWKSYCKSMSKTSKNSFIEKYGLEIGTKRYEELVARHRYCNSLPHYEEKYGKELGQIKYEEHLYKVWFNSRIAFSCGYSKISQELFWQIYQNLSGEKKKICFFAELNEEVPFFVRKNEIKMFLVDFKCGNKIIEFDGDYWHSLERSQKRDSIENKILQERGYKLLRIKEQDYKQNKNIIIENCIKFVETGEDNV
jgi:hypothetical protein